VSSAATPPAETTPRRVAVPSSRTVETEPTPRDHVHGDSTPPDTRVVSDDPVPDTEPEPPPEGCPDPSSHHLPVTYGPPDIPNSLLRTGLRPVLGPRRKPLWASASRTEVTVNRPESGVKSRTRNPEVIRHISSSIPRSGLDVHCSSPGRGYRSGRHDRGPVGQYRKSRPYRSGRCRGA